MKVERKKDYKKTSNKLAIKKQTGVAHRLLTSNFEDVILKKTQSP